MGCQRAVSGQFCIGLDQLQPAQQFVSTASQQINSSVEIVIGYQL